MRTVLEITTRTAGGYGGFLAAGLRSAGFGLVFMSATWALTPEWLYAFCVGIAAALVVALERGVTGREHRGAVPQHREADRDAVARAMTLELAYDRSQSVLASLREGVLVVDGGGEIVFANPAAWRALSQPDADPVGQLLWEVLPDRMSQQAREAWRALHEEPEEPAKTEARKGAQIRYSSVPCRELFFDMTAVQVTSAETGHDFGTVFLFVDITRNHELQRLKDRFLSSVSHELRTPLTNICAYSEILNTMMPGESMEWPEFVKVIHQEGLQLSHLVDGMFDFLQLESGEAEFSTTEIEGGSVVMAVADAFTPTAEVRGIELLKDIGSSERLLRVDRSRFEQACQHLVDNAVKFTTPGGRVQLSWRSVGDDFELRVDDSGPGVPEEEREAIFDKFTQLPDHLTEKPTGAGLGLAKCRAIVSRSGGLVWCEESPLGGAAFVVRLPAVPRDAHAIAAVESPSSAAESL